MAEVLTDKAAAYVENMLMSYYPSQDFQICLLLKRDFPEDQTKLKSLAYVSVVSIIFVQKGRFLFFCQSDLRKKVKEKSLGENLQPIINHFMCV